MSRVVPLLVLFATALIGCTRATLPPERADLNRGPAFPNAEFRIAVIGDFGTGDDVEYQVARSVRSWVKASAADALLTTGDNIYPSGHPDSFERGWTDPYGWTSSGSIQVIGVLGNHDIATDGGEPVMSLLGMPARWYVARVGEADIFVLDANDPINEEQQAWLERELRSSKAKWQIAVFHQPVFSCAEHDGDPAVRDSWTPLFESYGVDLVLNGHDHTYQRFDGPGGTPYVVTGGAGADLYELDVCDADTPPRIVADDERHHFLSIEGNSEQLRVRSIAVDATVIDDFTIR